MEFTELTDIMKDVDFKVFSGPANQADGRVVGLRVPGGGEMSRGEIDGYGEFVKIYGAKGLAWIKVNDAAAGRDGLQSPIVKNLHDRALAEILARTGAQSGDVIFFGADRAKVVNDAIGALRVKIGHSEFGKAHGLVEGAWRPLWVVDFPMFEFDEDEQRWNAVHHPFTSPKEGTRLAGDRPGRCLAKAYDAVQQRHRARRRLGADPPRGGAEQGVPRVKIGPEEAEAKFRLPARRPAVRRAAAWAASPSALDRFVMLMTGASRCATVIAFPKTQRAADC